jgi:hypothetical protein
MRQSAFIGIVGWLVDGYGQERVEDKNEGGAKAFQGRDMGPNRRYS